MDGCQCSCEELSTLNFLRMKFTALSLLATAITISATAQSFSPYDWATYYAKKKTTEIKIDGELDDWKSVKGIALDQEKYFFVGQGMSSSKWKGVADLYGNFKVQWDEGYVYIAVEVWDDKVTVPHGSILNDNSSGSWDDDGVEIMFDNDGCARSKYYIGDSIHHEFHFVYDAKTPFVFDNFWIPDPGAPQPLYTLPSGETEPLAYAGEAMSKNNVTESFSKSPYGGIYKFRRTEKGYNLEVKMRMPGAIMKPINAGGQKIGFDICVNDNDEGKGPLKQQLHWSGMNALFWRDCRYFGTLVLIDR